MHELTIIKQNGGSYIDSREVAEIIGKAHRHLLRDIRGYCEIMLRNGLPNLGLSEFFVESSFMNLQNKEMPCYLISKMGCELVANKLIGEKGVLFTVAYVKKFNEMEAAGRAELEALVKLPAPRLGECNTAVRIIVRALQNMDASPERILAFLKEAYEPFGISVSVESEFDDTPRLYTAKQIAHKLGVYSVSGNPHYHAVACILNENIFIEDRHKTVVTENYGSYTGICVRYDDYAVKAVKEWLDEYGYPNEIYGFDRTYRVLYKN